jgi:DNA-binding transcriptional MerR regulator
MERWTIDDLVTEAKTRLEALPPPKNGQVRAVPDERTVRYYGTLGLLDPPAAMRGRTALYGPRHLAQIVAIKRMQSAGHSLADIQELWRTLDDTTLTRITGVELPVKPKARRDFWKQETPRTPAPAAPLVARTDLRIDLAPGLSIVVALADDATLSSADIRALRAAAASLVTELTNRGLIAEEKS